MNSKYYSTLYGFSLGGVHDLQLVGKNLGNFVVFSPPSFALDLYFVNALLDFFGLLLDLYFLNAL